MLCGSSSDLLELPDVAGHFLPLLTAKPKKESKPKSKSEPKPKLSPKKGKVRKKISKHGAFCRSDIDVGHGTLLCSDAKLSKQLATNQPQKFDVYFCGQQILH